MPMMEATTWHRRSLSAYVVLLALPPALSRCAPTCSFVPRSSPLGPRAMSRRQHRAGAACGAGRIASARFLSTPTLEDLEQEDAQALDSAGARGDVKLLNDFSNLSSLVFYDDLLDSSTPAGVVCARGVCVLNDDIPPEICVVDDVSGAVECAVEFAEPEDADWSSAAFLWPRALLLGCSVLYGTNFPLGRLMNAALPPSATSSARFALAALALSPFLPRLAPELARPALFCGVFTSLGCASESLSVGRGVRPRRAFGRRVRRAVRHQTRERRERANASPNRPPPLRLRHCNCRYVAQSIALVDTPASTVAFLGALTVVVCPALEALVGGRRLAPRDAPQVVLGRGRPYKDE